MKNLLQSPPDTTVESLAARAQARRLQVSLRLPAKPAVLGMMLFIGLATCTAAICKPLFDPIVAIGDSGLTGQTFLALVLFAAIGLVGLLHCTVPICIQSPPKYLAALPITMHSWQWPQIRSLYTAAMIAGHAVLAGLATALILSGGLPPRTVAYLCAFGLPVLWLGLGFGRLLNGTAQRFKRAPALCNGLYAAQLLGMLLWLRGSAGIRFLQDTADLGKSLPFLLPLITVCLAVTLFFYKSGSVAARSVLAEPVRFHPPRSGRHANPATASGTVHPVTSATIRGLRHDFQSAFFAVSVFVIAFASIIVAAKLQNPLFTSAIITNNATMVPLGLASWYAFARQKIGRTRASIYKKPQSSTGLVLLQALPISAFATLAATLCTLAACWVLGTVPLADEIIRLGGLACIVAIAGYTCGVAAYPVKGEHASVLITVIITFLSAGVIVSADQVLRVRPLGLHIAAQLGTAVVFLIGCITFERLSQKGLRT